MLSIRNLSFAISASRFLLKNVSFDIQPGSHTIIVGQNGAGKSTLLKCITRILTNWTGEILLDGTPIKQIPLKTTAKRIAILQQSSPEQFPFTVRQIVQMGRYPHLAPFSQISVLDNEIVDSAIYEVGAEHLSSRMLGTLSGGERQKVFLAAALAQEPEFLLLDEPTTFLDYRHQSEIAALLRKVNINRKTTILEVTHDVNRAVLDGWHVIALNDGSVVFNGTPNLFMQPDTLQQIFGIGFQLVEHPSKSLKMIVPGI